VCLLPGSRKFWILLDPAFPCLRRRRPAPRETKSSSSRWSLTLSLNPNSASPNRPIPHADRQQNKKLVQTLMQDCAHLFESGRIDQVIQWTFAHHLGPFRQDLVSSETPCYTLHTFCTKAVYREWVMWRQQCLRTFLLHLPIRIHYRVWSGNCLPISLQSNCSRNLLRSDFQRNPRRNLPKLTHIASLQWKALRIISKVRSLWFTYSNSY